MYISAGEMYGSEPLVTAALFNVGKYLISLYLGTNTLGSTYGAAGSLVILLLWVYYSSMILFLGAEFTQVYANKYGSEYARPASS
jgi:membrane protein